VFAGEVDYMHYRQEPPPCLRFLPGEFPSTYPHRSMRDLLLIKLLPLGLLAHLLIQTCNFTFLHLLHDLIYGLCDRLVRG
jgi:hypothetical protein